MGGHSILPAPNKKQLWEKVKPLFDYDPESKKAVETLDKYDFSPVLEQCRGNDVYEAGKLIGQYGEEATQAVENLTEYELATYLHQKYDMKMEEVSQYLLWWRGRK